MDHEFGSNQLTADQVGWDWFSVQLDDNSELMLYTMRLANGGQEPNSSGTLIYADGKSKHLPLKSYRVEPREYWTSPHTGAKYPSK
ncbi:lipocalin family protein, partial [Staphylococcus aureus]